MAKEIYSGKTIDYMEAQQFKEFMARFPDAILVDNHYCENNRISINTHHLANVTIQYVQDRRHEEHPDDYTIVTLNGNDGDVETVHNRMVKGIDKILDAELIICAKPRIS